MNTDRLGAGRPRPISRARGFLGSMPATPPPKVLDALGYAALVLDELAVRGIGLRLDLAEEGRTVRVRVTRADGRLIQVLTATAALDLLAGGRADGFLAGTVV